MRKLIICALLALGFAKQKSSKFLDNEPKNNIEPVVDPNSSLFTMTQEVIEEILLEAETNEELHNAVEYIKDNSDNLSADDILKFLHTLGLKKKAFTGTGTLIRK